MQRKPEPWIKHWLVGAWLDLWHLKQDTPLLLGMLEMQGTVWARHDQIFGLRFALFFVAVGSIFVSLVYIYIYVCVLYTRTHTHIYIYTYQLHFLKLQCECVPFNQRLYRWISEYPYVYFLSIPMYGHPHSSFQMSSIRQAITGHSRVLDIPPVAWRSLGEEFWRIHLLVFWLSRSHKKPPMGGWSSL